MLIRALHALGKYGFIVALVGGIGLLFVDPTLPESERVLYEVKTQEPIQREIADLASIHRNIKGFSYTIEPTHEYELYGLVVSQYDSANWLDYTHREDPGNMKDICVVWGSNIGNNAYLNVEYWSGEFTCYYRWYQNVGFSGSALSNNHLIPADERIADIIQSVRIGDQIRLKGVLANYTVTDANGRVVFSRRTSTTRNDTSNGACEIVYVTDAAIIQKGDRILEYTKRGAWYTAIAAFVLFIATIGGTVL